MDSTKTLIVLDSDGVTPVAGELVIIDESETLAPVLTMSDLDGAELLAPTDRLVEQIGPMRGRAIWREPVFASVIIPGEPTLNLPGPIVFVAHIAPGVTDAA